MTHHPRSTHPSTRDVAHVPRTQGRLQPGILQDRLQITAAMQLLDSGLDISVIALWLGHESVETTQIYLHADLALKEADLALKEKALARIAPPSTPPGRYQPTDTLLAFLETL
jgi:integrase/recombinase XerD